MTLLLAIGIIVTLAGVGLLGWCVRRAAQIRRDSRSGEDVSARLHGLVALNMGAVGLAFLGLAIVVVSLIL
ncbi:hypothetical protein [Oceanomicrobium pacificus]|uniref:Uncharacterized protein n=1 Tax=Oceanomicrobium pacificus TaxID=2692916 RepID=A0A6B0TLZ6_9RHOB|nr:hypothetical protein [Oceanomicrobium pacificus]MXU65567.1 hypothetical protein [Oceanomicrobium pacificus]